MNEQEALPIEVGAADQEIRYWVAKEAVRQGELQMSVQMQNLQAAEVRATSILGWMNAGILAGVAVLVSHELPQRTIITVALAIPAFATVAPLLWALFPKQWVLQGVDIPWLLAQRAEGDTELAILEAIAKRYIDSLQKNQRRLNRFSTLLRYAVGAFASIGVIAVVLVLSLTSS